MSEYVNQVLSVLSQANQTKQATAEQPQVTFEDKRGLTHMEKQASWKALLPLLLGGGAGLAAGAVPWKKLWSGLSGGASSAVEGFSDNWQNYDRDSFEQQMRDRGYHVNNRGRGRGGHPRQGGRGGYNPNKPWTQFRNKEKRQFAKDWYKSQKEGFNDAWSLRDAPAGTTLEDSPEGQVAVSPDLYGQALAP